VEIGSRSSEQLTKFNNNDLALSKGSPLPFEVKGTRPVLPQHWLFFFSQRLISLWLIKNIFLGKLY